MLTLNNVIITYVYVTTKYVTTSVGTIKLYIRKLLTLKNGITYIINLYIIIYNAITSQL